MKNNRVIVIFSIMLLLVLLILSCATPPKQAPFSTPAGNAQYGGNLRILTGLKGNLPGDMPKGSVFDLFVGMPAVETLLRYDKQGRSLPFLATEWKVNPDGKTITMSLRKDVKFHDGTDFNAEVAKFNIDRYMATKKPALAVVTSVDVVDSYTIRLNLSKFDSALLYNLGLQAGGMISPTAIKAMGDKINTNPVGTGPFKFASMTPDVGVKFTKFDGYWQKGKPYLDGIEFIFITDAVTQMMSLQAKEGDLLYETCSLNPKLAGDLAAAGFVMKQFPSNVQAFLPDSRDPNSPFANRKVREAVEYSVNRPEIIKAIAYGRWDLITQPCTPYQGGYDPSLKERAYDPNKAKQLLAEAGYPQGFKTTLHANLTQINKDAMVAVQSYLKAVGIETEQNVVDSATANKQMLEGWKGLNFSGLQRSYGNYCTNAATDNPPDYSLKPSMLRPTGYAELIDKGSVALDFDTSAALQKQLAKLVYDEVMAIPMYGSTVFSAATNFVHGEGLLEWSVFVWSPENAWLSK